MGERGDSEKERGMGGRGIVTIDCTGIARMQPHLMDALQSRAKLESAFIESTHWTPLHGQINGSYLNRMAEDCKIIAWWLTHRKRVYVKEQNLGSVVGERTPWKRTILR